LFLSVLKSTRCVRDVWLSKRVYLLWVELEASASRFAGTGLVSSGCTDSGFHPTQTVLRALDMRDKEQDLGYLMYGLR
jgi:hypothetical protein